MISLPEPKLNPKLRKLETQQSERVGFDESPPIDLVAFNELRSCADLFRMHSEKQLQLDPDFQRQDVWPPSSQTRFVDSLIKQLPIPSLCISYDFKSSERQVVDGRQRISSIVRFLDKKSWKLSKLDDIDQTISNKTNLDIKTQHPEVYARLQNTTIPVTVLRCDLTKESHREYMFTIFHRLNAGGMRLNNQEIRNCIYSGTLNDFLKEAANSIIVKKMFKRGHQQSHRFSSEELILRILSFRTSHSKYRGPLSKHLNEFMARHRNPEPTLMSKMSNSFLDVAELIYSRFDEGEGKQLAQLSKATLEALFVGVMRNFRQFSSMSVDESQDCLEQLLNDPLFSTEALVGGLAAKDKVIARLDRSVEIFSHDA